MAGTTYMDSTTGGKALIEATPKSWAGERHKFSGRRSDQGMPSKQRNKKAHRRKVKRSNYQRLIDLVARISIKHVDEGRLENDRINSIYRFPFNWREMTGRARCSCSALPVTAR
jgi:hypothetical protein